MIDDFSRVRNKGLDFPHEPDPHEPDQLHRR